MQVPKPTEADTDYFRAVVPDGPGIEVKPMFGNLGAFVNGNMFMGLFGSDLGVRLAPPDAAELLALAGTGPFGPPERPMGGWVTLPASFRNGGGAEPWIRRALDFGMTRPPKAPKGK